jgi:hypothetical protein
MYELVRVGVPIKSEDVSNEFLNILKDIETNSDSIAVSTTYYDMSEFDLAPAGTSILVDRLPIFNFEDTFKPNCINTIGFIWELKDSRGNLRNIKEINAPYLISLFNNQQKLLNFKKIYMFVPGSPTYSDSMTDCLADLMPIKIIESKSSFQHSVDEMKKIFGNVDVDSREYYKDFISGQNPSINVNNLTVFSCLQNGYNTDGRSILDLFFNDMSKYFNDDAKFISVHVGDPDNIVILSDFYNARTHTKQIQNYPHMLTIGVIQ